MSLYLCGTRHICIYYLYKMTFWESGIVILKMSLVIEVDFNYKFWFIIFVPLHWGCCIIKCCIEEVRLNVMWISYEFLKSNGYLKVMKILEHHNHMNVLQRGSSTIMGKGQCLLEVRSPSFYSVYELNFFLLWHLGVQTAIKSGSPN